MTTRAAGGTCVAHDASASATVTLVGRRFKRATCAACKRYLLPGRTARVGLQPGRVVIACDCGERARIPTGSRGEK